MPLSLNLGCCDCFNPEYGESLKPPWRLSSTAQLLGDLLPVVTVVRVWGQHFEWQGLRWHLRAYDCLCLCKWSYVTSVMLLESPQLRKALWWLTIIGSLFVAIDKYLYQSRRRKMEFIDTRIQGISWLKVGTELEAPFHQNSCSISVCPSHLWAQPNFLGHTVSSASEEGHHWWPQIHFTSYLLCFALPSPSDLFWFLSSPSLSLSIVPYI